MSAGDITLGRPLTFDRSELDTKEGMGGLSISNPGPAGSPITNTHEAVESRSDNHVRSTTPNAHSPAHDDSPSTGLAVGEGADGDNSPSEKGIATQDIPSQARPSNSIHNHSGVTCDSESGKGITRDKPVPVKEETGAMDMSNVNALLNLPPPLPFDLKVSNLWVGVPHRGPSS